MVSDELISPPHDSQLLYNDFHYKVGVHGLIFRWDTTTGWYNTASAATKVVILLKKQAAIGPSHYYLEPYCADSFVEACPKLLKEEAWHPVTDLDKFALNNGMSVDNLAKLLCGSIRELNGFEWRGVDSTDPRGRYLYYFQVRGVIVPIAILVRFAKVIDMGIANLRTFVRSGKTSNATLTAAGVTFLHRTKIHSKDINTSPSLEKVSDTRLERRLV